jgi:hypothetical protein
MERKQIARVLYNIFQKEKSNTSFLEMADFVLELLNKPKDTNVAWIDKWLQLFPEGVKNAGKLLRSDRDICVKKMEKFLKKYDYTPQEIMYATEDYLAGRSLKNYEYTMLASNFISHPQKGSLLAELCEEERKNKKKTILPHVQNDFI